MGCSSTDAAPALPEAWEVVKSSWEDYADSDLEVLVATAPRRAARRTTSVWLRDGEARRVREEWFDSVEGTPLYIVLWESRWMRGNGPELDCHSETFDDICAFLQADPTLPLSAAEAAIALPPEKLRARRRRLRQAADYYMLEALAEALDEAEEQMRVAAAQAENAARLAAQAASQERRRAAAAQRRQCRQRGWRRPTEDLAHAAVEQLEGFSMRHPFTKAQGLHSALGHVQRACQDAGGPNEQRVYSAPNTAKRNRQKF